jgi:AAHS family 4-hydroxybenzoate transporter-like MFS transporter
MSGEQRVVVDIGQVIDAGSWGRYQKLVVLMVAFTVIFDGLDIQILGLAVPALMKEWNATRAVFAPVIALSLIGMTVGTLLAGAIGDRIGRKAGLIGSVLVFGLLTLATGFADDVTTLTVLRFLAGMGLGGALPNSSALNAEMTPMRWRAQSVMLTILCVPLGSMLGGLLGSAILPTMGWRTLFIVGGLLPVAVAVLLIFVLPESPRYLVRHPGKHGALAKLLGRMGHSVPAGARLVNLTEGTDERISIAALFVREYRFDTIALWIACFFTLIGTYSVLSWLPAVLTNAGMNSGQASAGITSYNFGGVLGVIAALLIVGRMGSKLLMLGLCAGVTFAALYLRSMHITMENGATVIAIIGVMGFFLNATQTSLYALSAHVYVSRIRSTGVGGALGFGRIGAVLSSYLVPAALMWNGSSGYFLLIAVSLLCSLLALAVITRHVPPGGESGSSTAMTSSSTR